MGKRKKTEQTHQDWCLNFTSVTFGLGKSNMVILLFEEHQKKEIDNIWKKHVDPFNDFKIIFIEDRNNYSFIMYRKSNDNFGFYKQGFDIESQYHSFKSQFTNSLMFRYGFHSGKDWRLSSNYKMVSDVSIMEIDEVVQGSVEWSAMNYSRNRIK